MYVVKLFLKGSRTLILIFDMLNYISLRFQKWAFTPIPRSMHLEINESWLREMSYLCPRSNKLLAPDVTTSKFHFVFFMTNSKPFVKVVLKQTQLIIQMKSCLDLVHDDFGKNCSDRPTHYKWPPKQLFWARKKVQYGTVLKVLIAG